MSGVAVGTGAGHRRRFVGHYVVLSLGVLVLLQSFGMLSPRAFFVGAFVGYLLQVEITASSYLHPKWRDLLNWPARVGYLVFGIMAVRYLVSVVQSGLS